MIKMVFAQTKHLHRRKVGSESNFVWEVVFGGNSKSSFAALGMRGLKFLLYQYSDHWFIGHDFGS